MAYEIGEVIWFKGDEVEIITEPFELYGALWQDAIVLETGKRVTVRAPDQVAARAEKAKAEWREQQAGFRRIREAERKNKG